MQPGRGRVLSGSVYQSIAGAGEWQGTSQRSQAARFLVCDTLAKSKGQGPDTGQVGGGSKKCPGWILFWTDW